METTRVLRHCGMALAGGALVCAAAITLEAVTDPLDADRAPHYVAGLAAPVALLLFGGLLVLLVGLGGLAAHLHRSGTGGTGAVIAIGLGLSIAEIPHTILDASAIPVLYHQLPAGQAGGLINDHIDSLPGLLSGVGILPLLIGSIVLAVRQWNGAALPRWAPRFAIALLVLGIAELPLSSAAWWLPHGPVLLYVGIAGYGVGLMQAAATSPAPAMSVDSWPVGSTTVPA